MRTANFATSGALLSLLTVTPACAIDSDANQPDQQVSSDDVSERPDPTAVDASSVLTTYISVLTPSGHIGPKVLDMKDRSTANGGRAQLWQRLTTNGVTNSNQRWTITPVATSGGHQVYELKNALSLKCLDMAIDVPAGNGVRVQQWDCTHAANQRWVALSVVSGNPWVELKNLQGKRCLDVTGANYADGALLQVWDCSGDWNQRWNIF